MQRDIDRLRELYAAFDRRDEKSILLLLAEAVEIRQSSELPWGGDYRGHAGVREFLGKLLKHLDSRVEVERYIDAGEQVLAVGRTVGKTRERGVQFDVPVVHVWTFQQGVAVRFEPYIDNGTMLAALRH